MNYIILDLEWNQPINPRSRASQEVTDRLIFEMIQIGAVRVNDRFEVLDSISIPIHPTCFTQIHPRIRKMTGLDQDVLADAPLFEEAMEQFVRWCGTEEYLLVTWGCDDVSVLKQNLDFFEVRDQFPPVCDLQHLFSDAFGLKERLSLAAALARMEIEPEEDRAFHNALNDAWYTALIFQKLPEPARIAGYPRQPKQLIRHRQVTENRNDTFPSLADALNSDLARKPRCPRCGKVMEPDGDYVRQSADKYISLVACPVHGMLLSRLRIRGAEDGSRKVHLSLSAANRATVAYVHTKRIQVAQKQEAWRKEHAASASQTDQDNSAPETE